MIRVAYVYIVRKKFKLIPLCALTFGYFVGLVVQVCPFLARRGEGCHDTLMLSWMSQSLETWESNSSYAYEVSRWYALFMG